MGSSNMQYYYNRGIKPLFDEIIQKVNSTKDNLAKEFTKIALFAFCRNTMSLLEIINKDNCTDSFAATMRLLMEISADVEFISKNPSNLIQLADGIEKINKRIDADNLTLVEAAKMANGLRLTKADGKESKTIERINEAYGNEGCSELYVYYCCYSHFNVAATIWTATRKQLGGDKVIAHSLYIFSFYADIFDKLVKAIGTIINNNELKDYDRGRINEVVKWLLNSNTKN